MGTHAHTYMHTDDMHRINFKKPCAPAAGWHMPGLTNFLIKVVSGNGVTKWCHIKLFVKQVDILISKKQALQILYHVY